VELLFQDPPPRCGGGGPEGRRGRTGGGAALAPSVTPRQLPLIAGEHLDARKPLNGVTVRIGEGCGAPDLRPEFCCGVTVSTKSDAPRDRYPSASRQVALFRPYRDPRPRFPGRPTVGEDEPLQAKTHPFASNHADGGRVWPATRSPDRSSIPLEPVPARPPPEAAKVAGRAPSPVLRGGKRIGPVLEPGMKRRERSWSAHKIPLSSREGGAQAKLGRVSGFILSG
jgi:hypothetical protein